MDVLTLWQVWLMAAVVLLCCELLDGTFLMTCFCVGALLASLASACGVSLAWQLAAFALASLIAFLGVRPLANRYLHRSNQRQQQLQIDLMAGRYAVVVETIDVAGGRVAIDGIDWRAESKTCVPIGVGEKVVISQRRGNTLIVKPENKE